MNSTLLRYANGGAVHAHDRIQYKGICGTVVFVTDGEEGEFAPGYEEYQGHTPGVMICDDDGDLTFLMEPDENLEFVRRAG